MNIVQGYKTTIARELDQAERFLALANEISTTAGSLNISLVREALDRIFYCQKILHTMTGAGEELVTPEGEFPINFDLRKSTSLKYTTQYILEEFTFIRGAICDPYIHGADDEFRAGAVMNLKKAAIILTNRAKWAVEENI